MHYVVPKANKIGIGEQALLTYFKLNSKPITKENMSSFLSYLKNNKYKIIKA